MASEIKKEIELEIAYVLFIDIVGYSKLLIDQQRRFAVENPPYSESTTFGVEPKQSFL
jgi:hypothetical protein